jgi:hypothetical protein
VTISRTASRVSASSCASITRCTAAALIEACRRDLMTSSIQSIVLS